MDSSGTVTCLTVLLFVLPAVLGVPQEPLS
jgi:hypothetical protein